MASNSLSSLLESAGEQFANLGAAKNALIGNYEQLMSKQDDIMAINRATAEDVKLVALTKNAGELAAEANTQRIARILGTSMDASSNLTVEYGQEMRRRAAEATQALDVIAAKEKVGFFDNPLEFIVNQITIGDDYAKYNAAVDQYNLALTKNEAIHRQTQIASVTENAIKQTMTAESAAANARSLASVALLKAKDAELDKLKYGNAAIKDIGQLDAQALDLEFKKFSAIKSDEQLAMQKAQFALSQEQSKLLMEQRADAKADKDKVRQEQELKVKAINAGRAVQNLPEMNVLELKVWEQDPKKRDIVQGWLSSGLDAMASGGRNVTIAPSPGDTALTLLQSKGSTSTPAINKLLTTALNEVRAGKTASGANILVDKKDPGAVVATINTLVKARLDAFAQDVEAGGADNLYALPPLKAIADQSPAVRNSPFYKMVLAPTVASGGMATLNATQMNELAAVAVRQGLVTFTQAVQTMSQIGQAGILLNNKTKDFSRVGIPPQKTANAVVNTDPSAYFSGAVSVNVDWGNINDWAQVLSKKLSPMGIVGRSPAASIVEKDMK